MNSKARTLLSLSVALALPVLAQNRESDILSIIAPQTVDTQSSDEAAGALDLLISGSPLDYISNVSRPSTVLDYISGNQQNINSGALDVISGAFHRNGFYQSGSWENAVMNRHSYNTGALMGIMPDWRHITSGYGYREWNHRMHKGIDIAMSVGDTIRAVMPGVVSRVDFEQKGYGLYVVLRHSNGMETRYAHLSRTLVDEGQAVAYGDVVALSGNTGNSTGPHLHFETRINGVAVNPLEFFNADANYASEYYGSFPAASSSTNNYNQPSPRRTYVVRYGDTVKSVAKKTGTRVLKLCQLNSLNENDPLEVGRMLILR